MVNGLVALDLSSIDKYLEIISFIAGLPFLYVVIKIRGVSSLFLVGDLRVTPLNYVRQIANLFQSHWDSPFQESNISVSALVKKCHSLLIVMSIKNFELGLESLGLFGYSESYLRYMGLSRDLTYSLVYNFAANFYISRSKKGPEWLTSLG